MPLRAEVQRRKRLSRRSQAGHLSRHGEGLSLRALRMAGGPETLSGRGRARGEGCSFLFKEKERTKGKPFWRKTAFFEKGWVGEFWAMLRRIGLYEADPPIRRAEVASEKKKLCLSTVSSRIAIKRKRRHVSSLPLEGEGGPPQVGDEVDLVFRVDVVFRVDLAFGRLRPQKIIKKPKGVGLS